VEGANPLAQLGDPSSIGKNAAARLFLDKLDPRVAALVESLNTLIVGYERAMPRPLAGDQPTRIAMN